MPRYDDSAQRAESPDDDEDYDTEENGQKAVGGYLFTATEDAPTLTLTEPLAVRSTHLALSVPPERIPPGQIYLLGSPGSPRYEVVQVDQGPAAPGRPRAIRRALFGTVVMPHPTGTPVTAISVEYVDDWDQWGRRSQDER